MTVGVGRLIDPFSSGFSELDVSSIACSTVPSMNSSCVLFLETGSCIFGDTGNKGIGIVDQLSVLVWHQTQVFTVTRQSRDEMV